MIILPIFDFEFRFQRPQQIAAAFAAAGHRVFWVSPTRMLDPRGDRLSEVVPIREDLWEVHLRGRPVDLYGGHLTDDDVSGLHEALSDLVRERGIAEACVLMQFPFWRKAGLRLREEFGARLIYDMMDDWRNWPTEPLIGSANLEEERRLVGEVDVLVVTAREFSERHAGNTPAPLLAPNGADFEFFEQAPSSGQLAGIPGPIVGYYGAISTWFDLEMVQSVAEKRPQYSFVLIGQVHAVDVSALQKLPNVHLLGEKHYREIPSYLRDFDVCLIPFRLNRLTRAVDPVKLYEYLSQGKAVVASPMEELLPHREMLYLAERPDEFLEAVDRAVAENDDDLRRRRVEFARNNTWRRRAECIDLAAGAAFPLVSILVVTYNSERFLDPFFDSLRRNTSYPNVEVVIVDNDSRDGTPAALAAEAERDPRVRVIRSERNLGFAGGNNLAAREARGEYLVLLNPDTMVTRGWIGRLMRPVLRDPAVGMAAPVTNFSGNETKIDFAYRNSLEMEGFAAKLARERFGESRDLGMLPLLCALLSRAVWQQAGELDERFEVGMFEDDDYSMRLRRAGYRLVTAEDCFIHHFGNGAFGQLENSRAVDIFQKNRERFEAKWKTSWREHKLRAGVRSPSAEPVFSVAEFCRRPGRAGSASPAAPVPA